MRETRLTPELDCINFDKSLRFYLDVLGFEIQYERPESKFAMLVYEGARLMLCQSRGHWQTGNLEYPLGRGINIEIHVSNVDLLHEKIVKAGHPIFVPMEEAWYRRDKILLGNRQFLVQDLDGYLLRFAQDLGEKSVS